MKILFFSPSRDVFCNPFLQFFFDLCGKRGIKIDLFSPPQRQSLDEDHRFLKVHSMPYSTKGKYWWLGTLKNVPTFLKAVRIAKRETSVFLIGVDPYGIIWAGILAKILRKPFGYFSFELLIQKEAKQFGLDKLKVLERYFSAASTCIIIQDSFRRKLFLRENPQSNSRRFFEIPVSPKDCHIKIEKNFRREFKIPKETVLVIYSGTLAQWSGVEKLLKIFEKNWPSDFFLVIHSPKQVFDKHPVVLTIKRLANEGKPVFFYNKIFSDTREYFAFLAEFDIGLAFYFPTFHDWTSGENVLEIGFSSGKISTYTMLAIPTITSSNQVYRELKRDFDFGNVIESMEEIPYALLDVKDNWQRKSLEARRLFVEKFEISNKLGDFLDYLQTTN